MAVNTGQSLHEEEAWGSRDVVLPKNTENIMGCACQQCRSFVKNGNKSTLVLKIGKTVEIPWTQWEKRAWKIQYSQDVLKQETKSHQPNKLVWMDGRSVNRRDSKATNIAKYYKK